MMRERNGGCSWNSNNGNICVYMMGNKGGINRWINWAIYVVKVTFPTCSGHDLHDWHDLRVG